MTREEKMVSEVIESISPHREELRGKKLVKMHFINSSNVYHVTVEP